MKLTGNYLAFIIRFRACLPIQNSEEPKLFTLQKDGNGKWIKDYTFTTPGIYVIKSVFVDGVEYELDEQLVVTIDGFALKSLSWGEGDGSSTTVMTADTTYSTKVYLQFQTNDASLMPKEVQGRFLRDDGFAVNVDFKKDSTGLWTGKSTFVTSGEYILQYLILDGNYTEIPDTMQKNASMFLGLKVNVYTSSPNSFKYVPTEMTDDQKNLAMSVEILTDTNEILPGRIGAKLHYGLSGSTISAMDTDLTWDASSESYIGTMHTPHAGVFTFLKVTIGENVISKAGRSVVFTILSPDPPKYEANRTMPTQGAPENNATFRLALSNAVSAIIRPVVLNTQTGEVYDEEYYNSIANSNDFYTNTEIKKFAYAEKDDSTINILDGFYNYIETNESTGGTTEFVFDIPIVKNSQGGMWQLIGLEVARVFDANGNEYTVDRPMYIDLTDE